jgi:hypothetical protein
MGVTPPEPPLSSPGWLGLFKGLTPTNAVAILILLCGLVPAYVVYRLVTDATLLDRFLSAYVIEPTQTACRLVKARERGETFTYAVTTGFAFEGQDRWSIGVIMNQEPSEEDMQADCHLLQAIIGYMHGMGPPPDILWQMEDIEGREGEKGER